MYVCSPLPQILQFQRQRRSFFQPFPSPHQAVLSTKSWNTQADDFFPLFRGNSGPLIYPLNSSNKSSTPVQKILLDQLNSNRNVVFQSTLSCWLFKMLHMQPLLRGHEGTLLLFFTPETSRHFFSSVLPNTTQPLEKLNLKIRCIWCPFSRQGLCSHLI